MTWSLILLAAIVAPDPRLTPDRLYYGIDSPVTVQVEAADGAALALALMEADGTLLAPLRPVRPGRVDVGALVPECLKPPATGRARYLQ